MPAIELDTSKTRTHGTRGSGFSAKSLVPKAICSTNAIGRHTLDKNRTMEEAGVLPVFVGVLTRAYAIVHPNIIKSLAKVQLNSLLSRRAARLPPPASLYNVVGSSVEAVC